MTNTAILDRFERRRAWGSFYLRERATGKRTRLYINLEACARAVARGELYTDAEYATLTTLPTVAAAPRLAYSKHEKRGS
jgi:hypothetical protein